eukprot:m.263515 g.263515  ORF g.263515 m.263515 type:complete len:618 (-) comp53624_c0_seq1:44-1897(-)
MDSQTRMHPGSSGVHAKARLTEEQPERPPTYEEATGDCLPLNVMQSNDFNDVLTSATPSSLVVSLLRVCLSTPKLTLDALQLQLALLEGHLASVHEKSSPKNAMNEDDRRVRADIALLQALMAEMQCDESKTAEYLQRALRLSKQTDRPFWFAIRHLITASVNHQAPFKETLLQLAGGVDLKVSLKTLVDQSPITSFWMLSDLFRKTGLVYYYEQAKSLAKALPRSFQHDAYIEACKIDLLLPYAPDLHFTKEGVVLYLERAFDLISSIATSIDDDKEGLQFGHDRHGDEEDGGAWRLCTVRFLLYEVALALLSASPGKPEGETPVASSSQLAPCRKPPPVWRSPSSAAFDTLRWFCGDYTCEDETDPVRRTARKHLQYSGFMALQRIYATLLQANTDNVELDDLENYASRYRQVARSTPSLALHGTTMSRHIDPYIVVDLLKLRDAERKGSISSELVHQTLQRMASRYSWSFFRIADYHLPLGSSSLKLRVQHELLEFCRRFSIDVHVLSEANAELKFLLESYSAVRHQHSSTANPAFGSPKEYLARLIDKGTVTIASDCEDATDKVCTSDCISGVTLPRAVNSTFWRVISVYVCVHACVLVRAILFASFGHLFVG